MKSRLSLFGLIALVILAVPLIIFAQRTVSLPDSYANTGLVVKQGITTNGSATPVNVQTNNGNLYGLSAGTGAGALVVYINVFNAASANVTAGTTTQVMSFVLDGPHNQSSQVLIPLNPLGIPFSTAISVNCTTTLNGATGAATGCPFTAYSRH